MGSKHGVIGAYKNKKEGSFVKKLKKQKGGVICKKIEKTKRRGHRGTISTPKIETFFQQLLKTNLN